MQAFTVEQVAKLLHVGRDKVYDLLRTGQLRSIKIGKLRRITEEHLAEFIASLEDHAKLQGWFTSQSISRRPFGNKLPNGLLLYRWLYSPRRAQERKPMTTPPKSEKSRSRRRSRGDDGISWDKANRAYIGTISLGYSADGTRLRRTVRGKTKAIVRDRLDKLHEEIKSGIHTPATYTIEQCVKEWLDSIERDEHTMATITGQAKNWIYPKIGSTKLKDFSATDADKFFHQIAPP